MGNESGAAMQNIDDYEKEKINFTIADLENTAATLRRYVALADELEAKGIRLPLKDRETFEKLRYEGGFAGPGGALQGLMQRAEAASLFAEQVAGENGVDHQTLIEDTERKVTRGKVDSVLRNDSLDPIRKDELRKSVREGL
ncbi:hypothetical protein HOG17_00240 [Candidatus Peregrinibacteria bacterium]|jgi:hypothetical protein|nr:hypothetical protein [Candidatus Peregrinibacteria bacterium]MBT4147689.1 hypothetical protein [Candidatus Peregrinibacteria bacterium]MBT4365968.1 hypothetical protein [Candidatus Peregrinibacteria bacterium]MBT4455817.1 hypothetical protein [Candidatus Peregrinibacteria bacterium]